MLQNGLNVRKKPAQTQTPHRQLPKPVFDNGSSEEDEAVHLAAHHEYKAQSSLKRSDIREDDDIYDYDGIYDSMKGEERKEKQKREVDKKERKPKYMQNLFEMSEVRKRDRLRAEDVKIQREREAEGDNYIDQEKFVTNAYRAQQEQLRKVAEDDAAKEARISSTDGGFSAFHQSILAKDLQKRQQAIKASFNARVNAAQDQGATEPSETELEVQKIREAETKLGHKIALNDDNHIVDHRQLLGAGLNRPTKSSSHLRTADLLAKPREQAGVQIQSDRQAQLQRQKDMIKSQLRTVRRLEHDEEVKNHEALSKQAKRSKTQHEIDAARARFLARKQGNLESI